MVIGAGHAGVQAAAGLRAGGYGGPVTMVTTEAHFPYERPPLSKEALDQEVDAASLSFSLSLRPHDFFTDHRISVLRGQAIEIDRLSQRVQITGGRRLGYDHLVLATGASPRRITLPGAALVGVHELRTMSDALALRSALDRARRVVVLGGGFIGMEVASAACKRGLHVSVLEQGDRVLGRAVSPPVSAAVAAHHRAEGVRLLLGDQADRVVGRNGRAVGVQTVAGEWLPADLVVLGVGSIAEDGLARRAGLATDDGVLVDEWLLTSDPRISAIGDCASVGDAATGTSRRLESIQNATDQGSYVAARILGDVPPYHALPSFWSNQGALKLQMVRSVPGHDRLVVRQGDAGFSVLCLQDGLLTGVESVNDSAIHMAARRLLSRITPTEIELEEVDFDVRKLARRAMTVDAALPGSP
ncbi:NAD(P)/FAD-dependent oxidoreductase [Nocardioides sp. Root614]|uniref:NAD(P)/FAD-dependent oxidoreductase n=1 Tax=Nocardioides sp. Root614 TaxID=1736571 RepID=UPI00138F1A15|nr:FAD-dependent oxidoreductase [Nocardioides sp. Root614]